MGPEENFSEIFRRLEATDRHIVDIQNKMMSIQKDVDDKFNNINALLLKLAGNKPIPGENGSANAAWVRQSIGLALAVITILGFSFTTFNSMITPFQMQLSHQNNAVIELKNDLDNHIKEKWHQGAAIAITSHSERFKIIEKEYDYRNTLVKEISDDFKGLKANI